VTPELRNWSGTYQFTAREVIDARTIGEVQRAVAAGGRVRALGTRHSFNDLADNGATLVSVTGIAPDPVIDEAAGTVSVGAGTSYGALAAWLQDRGLALANLGSLPHISIAGATATGTHGSGSGNRILSAAVAGLEYVAADGELRYTGRENPDFDGMPVGLGAFGIVVRVTLDIEPTYLVRQDAYTGLSWDRALADLEAIMDGAYSVSLFTDWSGESLRAAWVKRRIDSSRPDDTPPEFFGARREPGPVRFIDAPADNLTELGTAGPWSQRLPHFRLDSTPSNGDEIQSEYFVDRRQGAAALEAVRRRAKSITPLLMISEFRSTAQDRLWLSGSYGRETLAIHFTWRNEPEQVDVVLKEVEAALEPFAARPHWGKVSHVTGAQVAEQYPRLGDARDLFERLDPDGRFSNGRLERLGVRAARSSRPLPGRPLRGQLLPGRPLPPGARERAGNQAEDQGRLAERRQVVHAGHEQELAAGDRRGCLPVRLDNRRVVGIAHHQCGGDRDFIQAPEHRRVLRLQVAGRDVGPRGRAQLLHHRGRGPGPSPDLPHDAGERVHVPGRAGTLVFGGKGVVLFFLGDRESGDARTEQDKRGHPLRLVKGQP
jgi:xylitol oxidase